MSVQCCSTWCELIFIDVVRHCWWIPGCTDAPGEEQAMVILEDLKKKVFKKKKDRIKVIEERHYNSSRLCSFPFRSEGGDESFVESTPYQQWQNVINSTPTETPYSLLCLEASGTTQANRFMPLDKKTNSFRADWWSKAFCWRPQQSVLSEEISTIHHHLHNCEKLN